MEPKIHKTFTGDTAALSTIKELQALRALGAWVRANTQTRTRPAAQLVRLLDAVAETQGLPKVFESEEIK